MKISNYLMLFFISQAVLAQDLVSVSVAPPIAARAASSSHLILAPASDIGISDDRHAAIDAFLNAQNPDAIVLRIDNQDIRNHEVSYIVQQLHRFKQLQSLSLSYNPHLTMINPMAFAGLNIRSLYLENNGIHFMAWGAFAGMPALENLYLGGNRLNFLDPQTFSGGHRNTLSQSLLVLDLSNNEFTHVPTQAFMSMPNLMHLNMHSNVITTLHKESFRGLDHLIYLNLGLNGIAIIEDDAFLGLSLLDQLEMRCNRLKAVGENTLRGLDALMLLDLDYNRLEVLNPYAFKDTHALRVVTMAHNNLLSINGKAFRDLDFLQRLSLRGNFLTGVPQDLVRHLEHLKRFKTLNLDRNAISRDSIYDNRGNKSLGQTSLKRHLGQHVMMDLQDTHHVARHSSFWGTVKYHWQHLKEVF